MNNLETFEKTQFDKIRMQVAERAMSSYGKNRLLTRNPTANLDTAKTWQQETAEAVVILNGQQHMPFMGLNQLEPLTQKIEKGFVLEAGELTEYADFLRSIRMIQQFLAKNQYQVPLLYRYSLDLPDFSAIEQAVYDGIQGNQVKNDASKNLRRIRQHLNDLEKEIDKLLQAFIKHPSNRDKLQERLIVRKNDRLTVPIKASFKNQISGVVVEESARGTTVYIEPSGVAKLNDKWQLAKAEEVTEVYQILATFTGMIAERWPEVQFGIEMITEFDLIFARGKYSLSIAGVEPLLNQNEVMDLRGFRHPLLENAVPLSVQLGENYHGLTITGPNAGGKTVVLKSIGLAALMAAFGLHLPVDEGTNINIFNEIFVDIGDQQSMENALSTFSGHLANMSEILRHGKRNTLVLLDEIGSGTEPNEGAALAIAMMENLYEKGSLLVVTTHYGEIKNFSQVHEDFTTAAMAFDEATLAPKYQLLMGETGDSHAFWLAKRLHIGENILKNAEEFLAEKNYPTTKKIFKQRKKVNEKIATALPDFQKGDKVLLTENKTEALFYENSDQAGEWLEVPLRRLKLVLPGTDLYPADYDLSQLFSDFATRKTERDLNRGSKKALKALDKEARERKEEK